MASFFQGHNFPTLWCTPWIPSTPWIQCAPWIPIRSRPQLSHASMHAVDPKHAVHSNHAVLLSDWSFHSDSATSVNLVYISRASSLLLILQPGATRRTSGTTCGPLEDPSSFSKSFFTFYCLFLNSAKYLDNFLSPFIIYFRLCHFPGYSEKLSKSFLFFIFYFIVRRLVSIQCDGTPG